MDLMRNNNNDINTDDTTNSISIKPIPLIFPPPNLCTDNGVMAAWAGINIIIITIIFIILIDIDTIAIHY